MLEGLAAWVLNTYVGEYVENLNTDQLSIALLQGAVELENLPLKKDALKSLGLPLQVKSGFIGKIRLQIPLRRMHSEPWVISIERLYLVAGPLKNVQYDEEKEKAAEAARKVKLLEALEAKMQIQKSDKQESSSWFSYGTSVLTNILENLQLNIKDVHIRYEDDTINPSCPFAFGVVIKNLSAQSTDGDWIPKFVSNVNVELMHKLIDLQNFSMYFDTHTTLVGSLPKDDLSNSLQREMYISNLTKQFKEHEYILSPVSAKAKMKRRTTAFPLRSTSDPRNTIDLNLEGMAFSLSEDQYRNMVLILKEFGKYERSKRYRKWRPSCPVTKNAKVWWKFAIQAHLSHIEERNRRRGKAFVLQRARDIVLYTKVYTSSLRKEAIDTTLKAHQTRMEKELSFDEIKILRELAYRELRRNGGFSKTPSPEPDKPSTSSPQAEGTLLQRWFPGWGGWYGSSASSTQMEMEPNTAVSESDENVGEPPPKISKAEFDQDVHDFEDTPGDGEDDKSTLTRDAVFAKLNFCLDTGSFKLLGTKTVPDTGDRTSYSILELECSAINMMFESRPRTRGLAFGLSVGGLLLLDKMTENSLFPCLVGSQNKERFGWKRQAGAAGIQSSSRISTLMEDSEVKLFELSYEKNPHGTSANYRFSVKTKPLDIVYNKSAFCKVQEVFSSKNIYPSLRKSGDSITAAARRQYETLKRQTQLEFKNSLAQLLEGTDRVKRWAIQLDISAPKIIIPESFQSEKTSMVVMDLGHVKFHNTASGSPDSGSNGNNDDEFLTPMSTPPNEPEGVPATTLDMSDLSQLNLTEKELYNKLYDQYTLELTDMQVMVGRMKDNWRHIYHRGSTHLHLVDRFTISLQLERRLIYTRDPQWPTVTVAGTLPSLTIHVNEHKVQTINNCIKSLSAAPPTPSQTVNRSSSSQSLAESSSGLNLDDLGEITTDDSLSLSTEEAAADKKMRELLEESQLLSMQFAINRVSLEIHSRDRALAELQVAGVRTNLTKRQYDTSVALTVHSLLVVDALQTYGQDYELLVASHRNITIDSQSGSIRDSATTSPIAMSPGFPPSSPYEQLPPTSSTGGLQAVQEVVSRAFQALINIGDNTSKTSQPDSGSRHMMSPTPDSEALISLEFEMISANSPSNTNTEGPLTVANFQFNNLDIIANQETVVEILSFLKRTIPKTGRRKSVLPPVNNSALSKSTVDIFGASNQNELQKSKIEVTAEFNRLSVLLMRLDETSGSKVAKKVATATMSCARLQATIESEITMTGSLGGFHVFDITPDVKRHQRVFSVGQDSSISGISRTMFAPQDMYKTANESILREELSSETKAFTFSFSKPLKRYMCRSDSPALDTSESECEDDCVKVTVKVASLCYTHSPRTLFELSHCVSEFKEYRASVADSIKNVASEVAKGMVAKRSEAGHNSSLYGSSTSLDMLPGNRHKLNQSLDRIDCEYFENMTFQESDEMEKSKIVLNAFFDSPAIVVPKSATSSKVLVAHLGQISINNTEVKVEGNEADDMFGNETENKPDKIFMEVRNMNLYSIDIDNDAHQNSAINLDDSIGGKSFCFDSDKKTQIMYDTTVQVTVDHYAAGASVINQNNACSLGEKMQTNDVNNDSFVVQEMQRLLDIRAKIQTPVKLELSKTVYEQILQTTDYMTYVADGADATVDNKGESEDNIASTPDDLASENASIDSGSKISSLSQSQIPSAFITKKFRLEVPLFSVELGGDFGDGERGVVELKLYRFLLDFNKDNPATTKVELSLKSLVMDDLLEAPDSPHRQIMVSKAPRRNDLSDMKPREFMSHSCPDNAIIAPVPMMPPSLPSSFHDIATHANKPMFPQTFTGAFCSTQFAGRGRAQHGVQAPCSTPPPLPTISRSRSHEDILEENLVHISLLLVDKASPEYTEKYNQTKRFIDVDFNCLEAKINLQTWVVLLDFLGLGAKVHDMDTMAGKEPSEESMLADSDAYVQAVVNSEVKLKVENLSIILNKPEYEFSQASMSKLTSHVTLRDGNFHATGQLGKMQLLDLSPSGQLYRERFMTVGQQAMEFDFFKYGIPDPWLHRDFDMKVKLRMASVRYTHTNKFQAEMLGFVQHFLQLQDVLGRMRAASAGKKINEAAFHNPRLLLDIEAGSPIILIPHSSRTSDVLVADLGTLSVKNCFKFDGDAGTFNETRDNGSVRAPTGDPSKSMSEGYLYKPSGSKMSSLSSQQTGANGRSRSGIISRTVSQTDSTKPQVPLPLTQSLFDELLPPRTNFDPMTDSIYGGLDLDIRDDNQSDIYDPTDLRSEGSSVDPSSPRSGSGLNISLSEMSFNKERSSCSSPTSPQSNISVDEISALSDVTITDKRAVFACHQTTTNEADVPMETKDQPCLLDIMDVRLSAMDLFSAERVEKRHYKGKNLHQDLEFPSCVIQRQGCKLLKEKCMLNLKIERNLEGDLSHAVPDFRVQGSLSSVHCCLDVTQYKLIRGLLDHNLGEKFENFKKDLMSHMQDPKIQTVLSGDVWTMISFSVDLNNVTLELLTSHSLGPHQSEVSLAKLDFIRSRLSYDLFSDQSKETDLVFHEILASDTRYKDVAINLRPSVFEKILQPTNDANSSSLQLELHYRATLDGTRFMVILNNMKLLCSFDWLIGLQEFIGTKPENPFIAEQIMDEGQDDVAQSQSSRGGSRTTSPLTTSGGIITKRGPIVEQIDVPFEFKLNVTETQFVVVENLASLDSNAVILKCTSVLTYRPKAQDKLLSCNLQSLEVFSCSLQAEEETALSIVDPLSISIDLNANPLPSARQSPSGGLLDATVVDQRQLLLEVTCSKMNVRLSYQDMQLFLGIMDSLPKQALQARTKSSPVSELNEGQIEHLIELGFSEADCLLALKMTSDDIEAAGIWLLENAKPVKPKKDEIKITTIELSVNQFCLCLIDDCQDADVPLVELNFHGVSLKFDPGKEGRAGFQINGDYYNRTLSGWEPLLEQWRCQAQWKNFKGPEQRLAVEISASDVLNINMTKTLLDLYNMTKDKWTEDYYKHQVDSSQKDMNSPGSARRKHVFTPYAIRNHTGSPIWFIPVTMSPSHVGEDAQKFLGQKIDEAYVQATDWMCVPPNEEVPFNFHRKEKIRHKKSDSLRVNQLVVKVDGWQRLSPLSVDKVGVYFRNTLPDISRPSIIKVNDQQPARVVFDIAHEGSARKVITLRSALAISNKLDGPIEIKMDSPIIPGRYEYLTINPSQQKPVPMTFVASRLWIRPCDWQVDFCDQPIQWRHVLKPGSVDESMRSCLMSGSDGAYRFCLAVRREMYPEEQPAHGLLPLPGHTVIVMPPVTVSNLLPIDLHYYFKGTEISGVIKPGKETQLHAADLCSNIELGINLENFPRCRELTIPPGTRSYKVKLRLYDNHDRLLELCVGILMRIGGSLKLTISAPYWLVNRSGLPLVFRQDDSRLEAAGQFEEHEIARIVSPLLFSFSDKEHPYLCMVRVGKCKHGPSALPQWCRAFALDKDATVCQLHVVPREGNRPDWVYNIGIEVKPGQGRFSNTAIVTFSPRYQIDNQSGHKLAIAQRHFTNKEALHNPDGHLTALASCMMPFHWPRQDLDQLLCVKLLDVEDCNWSGGFRIDSVNSFHVNMRDGRKNSILLKVEVMILGQTYHIIFTDAEETPPPFRIDNLSEVSIMYYQTRTHEDRLRALIRPQTNLPYTWDEPTLEPYLTLSVANGTNATYNLNNLGEGEQLCYQNFIYITVQATFSKSGSSYSDLQHKELVLDCEHDNHVIFRKKEAGKRSQLWRMTRSGMLEHEGLGQPLDPRSASSSRPGQRFVLDIADIALQPGKPVPLALKKADERRAAKQTWMFKNDMLCCSTGNFCVQSISGMDGLQDGAIAVLGPGPAEDSPVPNYMQISSQKLHPGSGCLTVRTMMDGPVRVIQISDISQRAIVQTNSKDAEDWEIYEETLNHKTNVKRKKPAHRNIDLDLNLKGGIGISVVNSVPEELLYIMLKNITVNYHASPKSVTFEMSVSDIQADNQLFGTSQPIMLFVTPSTKKDIAESSHALLISAHKIPNMSWNAEIFKHVIIDMKKLTVQLEEQLLWKLVQFSGLGQADQSLQKVQQSTEDLQRMLSSSSSVKSKRYYFGILRVNHMSITLSMLTSSGHLPPDLYYIKKTVGSRLVNFEDAKVDLERFDRKNLFETKDFFLKEVKNHYVEKLKGQAIQILGSVDFLGNPMGLVNDVAEGVSGLIEDINVTGFAKGIFHGVSNSTAKVAGSISDGFSTVHGDQKHNSRRQQIRSSASSSGGQIMSGLRGFGHGVYGGLKSVLKPIEGARQGGAEGFASGLYQGLTGVVTKPVAGILDLASGMSNAVRDVSRRTSHMQPNRVRKSRCCHGPGGLLPIYSKQQAMSQAILHKLNDHIYDEIFINVETVRSGPSDSLYVMITSHQVFFLKNLDAHKENIILNIKHSGYSQCRNFENDGRYYVEIWRNEDRSSIPYSSNKKPQIRCDKRITAQKVAQQINYAKNLFDDQKLTLTLMPEDDENSFV